MKNLVLLLITSTFSFFGFSQEFASITKDELKTLDKHFLNTDYSGATYVLNSLNDLYKQSGWKELKIRKSYDFIRGFKIDHIELIK